MFNILNESQLNTSDVHLEDIVIQIIQLDYGMNVWVLIYLLREFILITCQDENPIDRVRFYEKGKGNIVAQKIRKTQVYELAVAIWRLTVVQVSQMLPETFAEQHVRIYSKKTDEVTIYSLRKAFRHWCSLQNCTTPKVCFMSFVV